VSAQLAADFFLIAHDPFDGGRLAISTEILGCGLVGAEVADLILARRLRVDGDDLVVGEPSGREPGGPLDEADDYVLEALAGQDSVHPVRTWVEPLQDGLYALVGDRLVASGVLRREHGTRRIGRGRQPDRFPADDLLAACAPQQRLEQLLRAPQDLTLAPGFLAALIGVLGVDRLLNSEIDRATLREMLAEIEQNLPTDLRVLCNGVRAVTAEVSLRSR
jgi:Golgi phosphoprotein 3 (GPP34)